MKLTILVAAAAHLPLLVLGCQDHVRYVRDLHARQAASSAVASGSSSSSSGPASSGATPSATGSGTAVASGSGSASNTSAPALPTPSQVSVSLLSQNPTAVPLLSISAGESSFPTVALPSTIAAGSIPTAVAGAPPIPDISTLNPANYPAMDKTPPTDSPEVQQWIQEVASTGINIPNISVTVDTASCAGNPAAAADQSRCWWTCGGCTRDTDITTCPDKLTWGLTYDDGPAFYTPNLLDYLDQENLKSTFFTIGSRILEEPHILQTEYMGGHQIGVHTWSHPPLTTMTNDEIIAEFGWTKKITKDILGVTPNTFRPPYGDIDDRVRAIATAMGLTPVIWTRISAAATFDTGDFNINGGSISSTEVIANFNQIMGNATTIDTGFIVLEHDLFEQTVELATGYILPEALAHQPALKIEPVITCLNMPLANAYVETNNNQTNPPPSASGSAAVTLSSGAPGSVQATGGASSSSAATAVVPSSQLMAAVLSSGVLGAVIGVGSLLF